MTHHFRSDFWNFPGIEASRRVRVVVQHFIRDALFTQNDSADSMAIVSASGNPALRKTKDGQKEAIAQVLHFPRQLKCA
ncbi:MAG: hypothetical protein K9K30_00285 [Burkholderiaceae bacterium]|nr:hypothetical protein [Sulfuritalea sp.]MCF8173667.1 hypothetical protein [Burkholderiaceae bacterium]MCF8184430.1 hypothetical protein [Polynucleobacter sp.]